MNRKQIESLTSSHHRCNGSTCTCRCDRRFNEHEEMIIGPDPRAGVPCKHYDCEVIPFNGEKSREWYAENDPQSLLDSINAWNE